MPKRKRGRPRKPVDPDKPVRNPWRPVDDAAWLVVISLWEKYRDHPGSKEHLQALLSELIGPDRYQGNFSIAGVQKRLAAWRRLKRAGYRLIEFEGFTDILSPADAETYIRLVAAGFCPRDAINIIAKANQWELGRLCDKDLPDWAIKCLRSRE